MIRFIPWERSRDYSSAVQAVRLIGILLILPGLSVCSPVDIVGEDIVISASKSGLFEMHYRQGLNEPARQIELLLEESAPPMARDYGLEHIVPITAYLDVNTKTYCALRGRFLAINVGRIRGNPVAMKGNVRHELSHALLAQCLDGARVPEWFMEGLAGAEEGQWGSAEKVWLMLRTGTFDDLPNLTELRDPRAFRSEDPGIAYDLSRVAVAELLRKRPWGIKRMTSLIRDKRTFEEAFISTYGLSVSDFESALCDAAYARYRLPGMLINFALIVGVIGIFCLAARACRRRTLDGE